MTENVGISNLPTPPAFRGRIVLLSRGLRSKGQPS